MTSFFDDKEREKNRLPFHSESPFDYINDVDRPACQNIRAELDCWLNRIEGIQEQRRMIQDFRSKDWRSQNGAFFELYLHELMLRLDLKVKMHPTLTGQATSPDFLILDKDGRPLFYLEACIAGASAEEYQNEMLSSLIYDAINQIESTLYFIGVEIIDCGAEAPRLRSLKRFIDEHLETLDPNDIKLNQEHPDRYDFFWGSDGWNVRLIPIAKNRPTKKGRTLGTIYSSGSIDTVRKIRNKVKKKAKYGQLDLPLILGINVFERGSIDDYDVTAALFGNEAVRVAEKQGGGYESQLTRISNGSFIFKHQGTFTRFSGILVGDGINIWNVQASDMKLWHHPFAHLPLPNAVLPFAQKIPDHTSGRMIDQDGTPAYSFFENLPEYWGESD